MGGSHDDENKMHRRVSWLRRADVTILEFLHAARDARGNPSIQTPVTIAANTGHPRKYVGNRCRHLVDHDMVEKVDRGQYRLSDRGEELMRGQLDLAGL